MNKTLKIINNALFIVNALILFSSYIHIYDFSFIRLTICSVIVFVLMIINIIQIKKKNNIVNNKKYNTMFLLANVVILMIFLRDKFDPMIPIGTVEDVYSFNSNSSGLFIDYNTIYISILYGGILLYNLLNKEKRQSN